MAIVQYPFTGDGSNRIFPVSAEILGDNYLKIHLDGVEYTDTTGFDIINNSVVFKEAPADPTAIIIWVAEAIEDIANLGSLTNVDLVGASIEDINEVADNIELLQGLADATYNYFTEPEIKVFAHEQILTDESEIKAFAHEQILADKTTIKTWHNVVATIADMLLLTDKDKAFVRDYSTLNDGGGGIFYYDASQSTVNNGGTIIDGWVRQYSGAINVKWFGAKGIGTDDTSAIQNALDIEGTIFIPSGDYRISSTLIMSFKTSIIGEGFDSKFTTTAVTAYTHDYMMLCNADNDLNWIQSYPGLPGTNIKNIRFENTTANNTMGIFLASSGHLENLQFNGMKSSIVTSSEYLDMVTIKRIRCGTPILDDYQIVINTLGDALIIDTLHCHAGANKSLYINKCAGGMINGIINGDIYIKDTKALSISGIHNEFGKLEVVNSDIGVRDSYFWRTADVCIAITSTTQGRNSVELDNIRFLSDLKGDTSILNEASISTDYSISLKLSNVYVQSLIQGKLHINDTMGVIIDKSDLTKLTDFNDHSYILSKDCHIGHGYNINRNELIEHNDVTFFPFSSIALDSDIEWTEATATYYYDVAIIRDNGRLIGRVGGDGGENIAVTNGGSGVLLSLATSGNNPNAFYRIYRGTADNSYTEYVDIPFVTLKSFYDDGTALNGFLWKTRTASDVDVLNGGSKTILFGNNIKLYKSSVPAYGSWIVSDEIIHATPSAGGNIGWICIVAGTPGTWKSYGSISA